MSDDKEILVDDREKNESTENQDQDIHEDVCFICHRPESKVGKIRYICHRISVSAPTVCRRLLIP